MPGLGPFPAEVAHLPVCPRRRLPIPYIAEISADGSGEFTVLDGAKARLCLQSRLCAMCGLEMGQEVALIGDPMCAEPGGFWIEPPVHERCGEIAITAGPGSRGLCPFLSGEKVPRRPVPAGVVIVAMDAEELTQVGRTIPKRPIAMSITRSYSAGLMQGSNGPALVYRTSAGQIRRTRLFTYQDGLLTEVFSSVRAVRVQRRAGHKRGKLPMTTPVITLATS